MAISIKSNPDGAAGSIQLNGVDVLTVSNSGISTGSISANTLSGTLNANNLVGALPALDGSALTSLTANNLVGALPALDGSALTSLTANNLVGSLPAIDGSALTSLTANNLVGSLPAIDGSALTGIQSSRVTRVASGTLANGDVVSLNSDGTVSIVTETVIQAETGTAVVFENATSIYISVASIRNDKVVIGYMDNGNSNYGTAIVGTVSGTSISFGSPVVFESAHSDYISVASIGNDKVVIGYRDVGNSSYGTAIVGTVSGTSISFGSPVVFESAGSPYISVASIGNDKVVIGYMDGGNSNYGTAIVGTVTGTSISFGSPSVFESATSNYISVASIGNDKVVIGYRDDGNSNYGTAIVGTVTGTSISFGSPSVFESAQSDYISVASIGNDKVVIGYQDVGNSGFGTAIVRKEESLSTNVSDWLGISESNANNSNSIIAIQGAVVSNQTGLTTDSVYYVTANGSLSTANTGFKIGRALSNTELLITEGNA